MLPKHIKKDCRRFREMISPYIDGRITQDEKQTLESHLASCHECREELESLRTTVGLLHRLPQAEVPRSFTIMESKPAPVPSTFRRLCWASAVSALVLVLLFAGDLFHIYPEKSTGPSQQHVTTVLVTPTPNFTIPQTNLKLPSGTPSPNIAGTPLPNVATPASGLTVSPLGKQITPNSANTDNSATTTEMTKETYRWPVHQVEFAVLGVVVVMLSALLTVWRKGKRSSNKGG